MRYSLALGQCFPAFLNKSKSHYYCSVYIYQLFVLERLIRLSLCVCVCVSPLSTCVGGAKINRLIKGVAEPGRLLVFC